MYKQQLLTLWWPFPPGVARAAMSHIPPTCRLVVASSEIYFTRLRMTHESRFKTNRPWHNRLTASRSQRRNISWVLLRLRLAVKQKMYHCFPCMVLSRRTQKAPRMIHHPQGLCFSVAPAQPARTPNYRIIWRRIAIDSRIPAPEMPKTTADLYLPNQSSFRFCWGDSSDHFDVFSPRSFRPVSFVERDSLSLLQLVVAHIDKVRHVKEHVLSCPRVDKAKTFVRQPLNRTFCHRVAFLKECRCGDAQKLNGQANLPHLKIVSTFTETSTLSCASGHFFTEIVFPPQKAMPPHYVATASPWLKIRVSGWNHNPMRKRGMAWIAGSPSLTHRVTILGLTPKIICDEARVSVCRLRRKTFSNRLRLTGMR